jgi:phosphatidylglycerophosphate synthase
MLDAAMRRVIDPPLDRAAGRLAQLGVRANTITVVGFGLGLVAMAAIACGLFLAGLVLLLLNRLADGLDGAVARRHGVTDLGGFLDIVLDFIVYSGIVFAFALADPAANALAAAFLIFSFIGTASSFLAFATMAAKRRLSTELRGHKSLYYLGGLTEGTETILFFVAFCLVPGYFAPIAWVFGGLCWVTTLTRVAVAAQLLGGPLPRPAAQPGDD